MHIGCEFLSATRGFLRAEMSWRGAREEADLLALAASKLPLARLEARERAIREELRCVDQSRSAAWWKIWRKPHRLIHWLDLCNANGYWRERALRSISVGAPNGIFFLFALRRLNDWVPQVRAAARERIPLIAERSSPEVVVEALWSSLPHSVSWGRNECIDKAVLASLAASERVAPVLKSKILGSTSGPATAVLSQAGRTPVFDEWLCEFAENAIQPSVRAKAYRALLEGRMTWITGREWRWIDLKWGRGRLEPVHGERPLDVECNTFTFLKAAAVDRSPIVRRVAGDMLAQRFDSIGGDSTSIAKLLASDCSPSVAERGKYVLARIGSCT